MSYVNESRVPVAHSAAAIWAANYVVLRRAGSFPAVRGDTLLAIALKNGMQET